MARLARHTKRRKLPRRARHCKATRPRELTLPRVAAHELAVGEDVAFGRFEELVFGRAGEQVQIRVERVDFEEVAVRPRRRAGAAVARVLEVVPALSRAAV